MSQISNCVEVGYKDVDQAARI